VGKAKRFAPALAALSLLSTCAQAQQAPQPAAATLDPVVVSATRVSRPSYDLPVSIDVIDGATLREGQAAVNLSETLSRVPGLVVQNRQDYAQDLQISSRGFGARTAFGVRGVRLFADGIPATQPDGQGQAASFDLGSAKNIEVLRGPFSTLYGNASGGVIQIFTEDGPAVPFVEGSAWYGSYGSHRLGLKAGGDSGGLNYLASLARFETNGYRDHSQTTRDTANVKLLISADTATSITLIANALAQPNTQDPAGLSRAEVTANPRQVDISSLQFNTRKSISQQQGGLVLEHRFGADDTVRATAYFGNRKVEQYQAIPVAAQASPLSPGGVINLDNDMGGIDLRLIHRARLAEKPLTITLGANYDNLREHRSGYQNFIGATLGIKGALRRDEEDVASNFNQYLQADWQFTERWSLLAGIRASQIRFTSADHYITAANPDDSGGVRYNNTSPAAGLMFKLMPELHLYANAGRGFETPTLDEIAYRPGGVSGLNFGLQPQVSDQVEFGLKARPDAATSLTAALFRNQAHNEIVVLTSSGGRSTYQNAGNSRREGAELSASRMLGRGFSVLATYSYVAATYLDNFLTCTGSVCATPVTAVAAGNRMPGVPRNNAYAELAWHNDQNWFAALEARASSTVYANDVNSEYAAGYGLVNLRAGVEQRGQGWRIKEFFRVDNLLDRNYIGAIVVGDANSRYYEPAPRRSAMIGVSASMNF
jgi:iron complex outermembrane receptor protein